MARYCKIDFTANVVAAVELWDSDPGVAYVASDVAGPGWIYDPVAGSLSPPSPALAPVPPSVTNFQARAVMRKYPMPDGRSLFTTVDTDLRAAVTAAADKPEFDPARVEADLNWQA